MKRIFTAPNGKRMVYYDDIRTDPPGWYRHVAIPGRRRRLSALVKVLVVVVVIVILLPVALVFMGLLALKAILAIHTAADRTTRRCGRSR